MNITTKEWNSPDGKSCEVYEMSTSHGMTVSILALGASIQRVTLTDKTGFSCPIAMGLEELGAYERLTGYAGATLGPNAGRIQQASLPVDGQTFCLTANDGQHQLHGGPNNLSSGVWKVESYTCELSSASMLLSTFQPDGLDGYPGNRTYYTRYTLEDTNWLTIEYHATTDAPTYMNLSNHTYWNLSGDFSAHGALGQELQVFSNNVCINSEEHIPVDVIPVAGTAFDFRKARAIEESMRHAQDTVSLEQLAVGNGYNHAYVLNKNQAFRSLRNIRQPQNLKKACVLRDGKSGRTLKMMTDAPALVLYSGGYLPEGILLCGGAKSSASCAIALEAQDVPDVMHFLPSNYQLTTPEMEFRRVIRFHVS